MTCHLERRTSVTGVRFPSITIDEHAIESCDRRLERRVALWQGSVELRPKIVELLAVDIGFPKNDLLIAPASAVEAAEHVHDSRPPNAVKRDALNLVCIRDRLRQP